jgi:hypothetical protein
VRKASRLSWESYQNINKRPPWGYISIEKMGDELFEIPGDEPLGHFGHPLEVGGVGFLENPVAKRGNPLV